MSMAFDFESTLITSFMHKTDVSCDFSIILTESTLDTKIAIIINRELECLKIVLSTDAVDVNENNYCFISSVYVGYVVFRMY